MVHALEEANRILVSKGIMIDVRPLSVDVPLEIIYQGGIDSAGMLDMSPDIEADIAAEKAIEGVLRDKLFIELSQEFFDFPYYWQTVKDMEDDLEEFWKDDVVVSKEVWKKAYKRFNERRPQTQLRVGVRMKLGKYVKKDRK
jgi:hypothetical protein